MSTNETAADRGQPVRGEEHKQTLTSSYHKLNRSATTAAEESRPRATSDATPGEESVCVVTDLRRFSHARSSEATSRLEQARAAIAACIHDGITLGGVAEAQSRCELLLAELRLSIRTLALTSETLEWELL